MASPIAIVNIKQQVLPAPPTLQNSGAIVSQGATTLAAGTYQYLQQASDLASILTGSAPISTVTWSGSVATVTTVSPHGFTTSDTLEITIAGVVGSVTPTGYNGTFLCTVTGASTFTYPLVSNPGTATTTNGVYTVADVAELLSQVGTFFTQGNAIGVYVLELGAGNATDGVNYLMTAVTGWIAQNPGIFYAYLVPREWDANSAFLAKIPQFEGLTASTYFFVTTTLGTYSDYTDLMKCVYWKVEPPGIPATEFSLAADFYVVLSQAPNGVTRLTQVQYSYLAGVTPYPTKGNATTLYNILQAGGNYTGTGAEANITLPIIQGGQTADGNPFNYWYAIDWMNLNSHIALAAAVINGSNNPLAPLDYDQPGVNSLQAVEQQVVNRAITFGIIYGPVTVTAASFADYIANNPSQYKEGNYGGLAVTFTPIRGFNTVTLNLLVTQFPSLS